MKTVFGFLMLLRRKQRFDQIHRARCIFITLFYRELNPFVCFNRILGHAIARVIIPILVCDCTILEAWQMRSCPNDFI